jgi:quinol monooxygenase YgiN
MIGRGVAAGAFEESWFPMPLVIATLYPKPDKADETRAVFEKHLPAIHQEPGCLFYALHTSGTPEAPTLIMVESWASDEASKAHGTGPNMAALGADLKGLMAAAPQLTRMVAVPAGDSAKGALPAATE